MTNPMETVTAAMTTVVEIVGSVFNVLVGNPVLVVFLAAGLLGVGIGVFRRLKNAAR